MKIEKNIAPPTNSGRGRPAKYPFSKMEIGDSVFFENEPLGSGSKPAAAAHVLAQKSRQRGQDMSFSCRAVDGGVRIWRVA